MWLWSMLDHKRINETGKQISDNVRHSSALSFPPLRMDGVVSQEGLTIV